MKWIATFPTICFLTVWLKCLAECWLFQPHIAKPLTMATIPPSCISKFPVDLRMSREISCYSSMFVELLLITPQLSALDLWLEWSPWALSLCSTSGYNSAVQDHRHDIREGCSSQGQTCHSILSANNLSISTISFPQQWQQCRKCISNARTCDKLETENKRML